MSVEWVFLDEPGHIIVPVFDLKVQDRLSLTSRSVSMKSNTKLMLDLCPKASSNCLEKHIIMKVATGTGTPVTNSR